MSAREEYVGYNALVSYLRTINNKSYRGFLELNRHIIISSISSSSLNWNDLDNLWAGRFLFEARNLYFTLDDKVNTERSQRKKDLRTFWQGVIEECGRAKRKRDDEEKENLNPSKKHAQSVISLMCLIQGNSLTNAFEVDIEKNKTISKLKDAIKKKNARTFSNIDAKDIKLWKVEIPDNRNDQLNNFSFHDQDELLAMKKISKYFPFTLPEEHVHVIVKLPLLSLEEALSCILPPITYSPKCTTSKATTKANGDPPTKVLLWGDFFEEANRFQFSQQPKFEKPQFVQNKVVFCEEDVRVAIDVNICMVLNQLMGPGYNFSRRRIHNSCIPDFNCYLLELLILVFEAKRKHVLEDIGDWTFPEFYWANKKVRMVIQQIYNYMGVNELRYAILTSYDNHWFIRREHTELWISKTLQLQSESPPILKTYAYLARQAKENSHSPHPLVLIPAHGNTGSRILRSHLKLSSSQSIDQ